MIRFLAIVSLAIVVGILLGFAGHSRTFHGVQERFEQRPVDFPKKEGSPFEPVMVSKDFPDREKPANGESSDKEGNQPSDPENGDSPTGKIGSGFPVNVPAGGSLVPFLPDTAPKAQLLNGALHDFGTMQRRSKKSHTFVIKNIGKSPLDLKVEGSTCKCTIGTLNKSQLQSGEETGITLEWKTETSAIEFAQSAEIRTNDPRQPMIKLTVKGIVVDKLLVDPDLLDLGEFSTNEPLIKKVRVYNFAKETVKIKKIEWSQPENAKLLKFTHQEIPLAENTNEDFKEATQIFEVTIELSQGFPQGKLNGAMRIETDIEESSLLECGIRGRGVGDVTILGGKNFNLEYNILDLGDIKQSEGKQTKVFISVKGPHRDTAKLSVSSNVPEDALKVQLGEPTNRGESLLYPLEIVVPKDGPLSNYPGTATNNFAKIVLKSQSEFEQEIPIYLRLVVTADE
jgi:hypothetical protein